MGCRGTPSLFPSRDEEVRIILGVRSRALAWGFDMLAFTLFVSFVHLALGGATGLRSRLLAFGRVFGITHVDCSETGRGVW